MSRPADSDPQVAALQTITLEWVRSASGLPLSRALLDQADLRVVAAEVGRHLVVTLAAHVLADQLPPERFERAETVTLDVPATWWQMWKLQHPRLWRGWLAERWPVRSTVRERTATLAVDLTRYVTYPEQHQFSGMEMGRPVRVAMLSDRVDWSDWRQR